MKRNLESRVEVVTPVEEKSLQKRLREIIDVQLQNKRSSWEMQSDGTYTQRQPGKEDDPRSVHEILITMAESRLAASPMAKKKKTKKRRNKAAARKRN
jgi:polyphosphate kinase